MNTQGGVQVLRFEVTYRGGKLLNSEGEPVRLKEGAAATLYVAGGALAEPKVYGRTLEMLPAGTRLLVNVRPAPRNPALLESVIHLPAGELEGTDRGGFVEILLKDALKLDPAKKKYGVLEDVPCRVPSLAADAESVNHARKLIAEQFEPGRRSSTGSVYLDVYYREAEDGVWRPLHALREAVLAAASQSPSPST